jgi:hypothetical protein
MTTSNRSLTVAANDNGRSNAIGHASELGKND